MVNGTGVDHKYRFYSGHDNHVGSWLYQIVPQYQFHGIPYAESL